MKLDDNDTITAVSYFKRIVLLKQTDLLFLSKIVVWLRRKIHLQPLIVDLMSEVLGLIAGLSLQA
jgi:hypothetical protein